MNEAAGREVDVLVIGGGVVGVCVALELAEAGRDVELVERGALCSEASLGNACWIAAGYALPMSAPGVVSQGLRWLLDRGSPFSIKPRLSIGLLRWLWKFRGACTHEQMLRGAVPLHALNTRSMQLYRELAADDGLDFYFEEQGLLHVHLSDAARDAGEAEAELLRDLGVEAVSLDRAGLLELEPRLGSDVHSGVFFPDHAQLDPHAFVLAMAERAAAAGVRVSTSVEVVGATVEDGRVHSVETSDGPIVAGEFVLAAGAWSAPLARFFGDRLLMEPAKGYSVTVSDVDPERRPSLPLAVDDTKVAITPLDRGRYRYSSTLELAGFDPAVNPRRLDVNRSSLRTVLVDPDLNSEGEPWSGYRPLTPDGLPYIGRSTRLANLIHASGHGMLGVTHAPVTAELVRELVCGQTASIDLAPFRPDRY